MEFGIFLTMPSPDLGHSREIYSRGIEQVALAEELGFDRAWLSEHHFTNYSYISRPLVLLAHLAARTERIRLGTAIVQMPLHHPLIVAEEVAAVDVLSGGRIDLGVGKGYQKYQYERLGIEQAKDVRRYTESVDLLRAALSGEPFEFSGEFFRVPETLILPQPLQQPLPIWYVVNTKHRESVAYAVERNMNIFTGVLEPISGLTDIRDVYPDLIDDGPDRYIGTQRPVFVCEDRSELGSALEQVRWNARVSVSQRHDFGVVDKGRAVAREFPGEPTDERVLEDFVVFGTPEDCIRQIARLRDGLGCNYISASFWFGALSQDLVLRSMRLFAEKVMPAFR